MNENVAPSSIEDRLRRSLESKDEDVPISNTAIVDLTGEDEAEDAKVETNSQSGTPASHGLSRVFQDAKQARYVTATPDQHPNRVATSTPEVDTANVDVRFDTPTLATPISFAASTVKQEVAGVSKRHFNIL